ncbi:MAG: exodeoxyribonuclease VII large subunit [Paramuribaculum sp.]|nr:exodeoxyribonuclease VII large subunit [Paramuribaculum sp.]
MTSPALTLSQLNSRIGAAVMQPSLQNVWVVAELSDLRSNNGHAYMELIEKDAATGSVKARLRAIIWANNFYQLSAEFTAATGSRIATGMSVMVCGSVTYHAAYGLSFLINAINPSYTMGEVERRRREILKRLTDDGVIDLNRSLDWSPTPLRIAIISAAGAAGYGDFMHQLYGNSRHLRFTTRLFPAIMQGDRTSSSVIAALEEIAADSQAWDCVVIIRGGGATSDLNSFDDYRLALNIAMFPLPVIIGIGHERDITALDYVANMRVKTPTAAAEWLISRCSEALDRLQRTATDILHAATDKMAAMNTQLAYMESTLSMAPTAALQRATSHLSQCSASLSLVAQRRIAPEIARLDSKLTLLQNSLSTIISRQSTLLDSKESLLKALSPAATLARGYSITTVNGHALSSTDSLPAGTTVTTILARGTFTSTVISTDN